MEFCNNYIICILSQLWTIATFCLLDGEHHLLISPSQISKNHVIVNFAHEYLLLQIQITENEICLETQEGCYSIIIKYGQVDNLEFVLSINNVASHHLIGDVYTVLQFNLSP